LTVFEKIVISRRGGESRVLGENLEPMFEMVPNFLWDDAVWLSKKRSQALLFSNPTIPSLYKREVKRLFFVGLGA
jgi:hypothetical protein